MHCRFGEVDDGAEAQAPSFSEGPDRIHRAFPVPQRHNIPPDMPASPHPECPVIESTIRRPFMTGRGLAGLLASSLLGLMTQAEIPCTTDPGQVAYWPFDYSPTEVVTDATPSVIGGISFTPGVIGGATMFTRQNAMTVPSWPEVQFGTGDFTVEFWVRFDSLEDSISGVISHDTFDGGDSYSGWLFNICDRCGTTTGGTGNGGFGFSTRNLGQGEPQADNHARASADLLLPLGSWHHVAGVRQESVLRLYIDGVLRAEQPESVPTDVSNDSPIVLGALNPIVIQRMAGQLDEVSLYNRALPEEQIALLASGARKCRPADDCSNLVAELQDTISALSNNVASLQAQVVSLEDQVATLQTTNDLLRAALANCITPNHEQTVGFTASSDLDVTGNGSSRQIAGLFAVTSSTPGVAPAGGSSVSYSAMTQSGMSTAGFGVTVGNDQGPANLRGIDGDGARGAFVEELRFTLLQPNARARSGTVVLGVNRISAPGHPSFAIDAYLGSTLVGSVTGDLGTTVNSLFQASLDFDGARFDSIVVRNTHLTSNAFVVHGMELLVETP